MAQAKILASLQTAVLQKDFSGEDGSVIPAGTEVVVIPQTMAQAVVIEADRTLADVLAETRDALTDYQAELIRLADRLTAMQLSGGETDE